MSLELTPCSRPPRFLTHETQQCWRSQSHGAPVVRQAVAESKSDLKKKALGKLSCLSSISQELEQEYMLQTFFHFYSTLPDYHCTVVSITLATFNYLSTRDTVNMSSAANSTSCFQSSNEKFYEAPPSSSTANDLERAPTPPLAGPLILNHHPPTWPKEWPAWATLIGCFFLMFNSWGLVNAYGTFASYYEEQLLPGQDMLLLNLIGSTQSFFVLALSFVVGRLLDAGYSRYLIGVGWVLVTIGMFMLSLCNGDGQFGHGNYSLIWLTQGFVTGLGMACFFVSSSQSSSTTLHRLYRRALAENYHSCGDVVYLQERRRNWHRSLRS